MGFGEEGYGAGDGEADDVEVVALDAWDPAGGVALDAVGAGLVQGLAREEVAGEFGVLDEVDGDVGDLDVGEGLVAR